LKYLPDWFPGAEFKRQAKVFRANTEEAVTRPFNMVKRKLARGDSEPSFASNLLSENAHQGDEQKRVEERTIADVATTMFVGGTETTASALMTFILAMILFPEVQAKARVEMDAVFRGALPSLDKRGSTPYLNAVLLETLRWHPVAPVGVPHRLAKDDVYNGYRIPAGTIVMVNAWGILHDERRFPDPLRFNPDRWLSSNGNDGISDLDPLRVAFGYGRRICPGIAFAQSSLWIGMATILSALELRMKVDPITGEVLVPKMEFVGDRSSSKPQPFECDIRPRSTYSSELDGNR